MPRLTVVARRHLLASTPPSAPLLLLEGSDASLQPPAWSLDEMIDAEMGWIDTTATTLAAAASQAGAPDSLRAVAYLDALKLRYYMVKLLRVVAFFFEVAPVRNVDALHLVVADEEDHGYVLLLAAVARRFGWPLFVDEPTQPVASVANTASAAAESEVQRAGAAGPPHPRRDRLPRKLETRRLRLDRTRHVAARLNQLLRRSRVATARPRVVLCGNPDILNPLCGELHRRGADIWWMFDRFAFRPWLRWRPRGVDQLVVGDGQRTQTTESDWPERPITRVATDSESTQAIPPLECRGVDLRDAVSWWLDHRRRTCEELTDGIGRVERHLAGVNPHVVVLDEDATPLKRAVVAVARRWNVLSAVVQHGAPCVRFGFVPPAADLFFAWGETSRQRLLQWGAVPQRVVVTGSPRHDRMVATAPAMPNRRSGRHIRVLLLTTVPPRDDRPDAVEYHLTRRTYEQLLRAAICAVAGLGCATMVIRRHPRDGEESLIRCLAAEYPQLRTRIVRGGDLLGDVTRSDVVLSCASSAGVEATLRGVPVIQLVPAASRNTLEASHWGFVGTASCHEKVAQLIKRALSDTYRPRPPNRCVFANLTASATTRIADEIFARHDVGIHGEDGVLCRKSRGRAHHSAEMSGQMR